MAEQAKPLRIVAVDDDKDDLFLAKITFKKADFPFEFTGLGSGRALFEYIDSHGLDAIDLLLIDVNMPALNGHDVLAKLSSYENFSKVCVIMISLEHNHGDERISGHLGASAYIVKPETMTQMRAFAKQAFSLYESFQLGLED